MKECLWCKEQYENKRESSKFCSTSCRVMWNKKYGKKKGQVGVDELQSLYNSILTAVNSINTKNGQPPAVTAVINPLTPEQHVALHNAENKDQATRTDLIFPKPRKKPKNSPGNALNESIVFAKEQQVYDAPLVAENVEIGEKIKAIKAEKLPKDRDTVLGRKSWALEQKKRIEELEKQLK